MQTEDGEIPILEAPVEGHYLRDAADDPEQCEYFVPIRWLQTVPVAEAFNEIGLFGNQNSVCKPTTPKWSNADREAALAIGFGGRDRRSRRPDQGALQLTAKASDVEAPLPWPSIGRVNAYAPEMPSVATTPHIERRSQRPDAICTLGA